MNDIELASRLREVLCPAKAVTGWRAAGLTNPLIDQLAKSGAPLLRELVDAAVDARLASRRDVPGPTELAAVALRRRLGNGGAA